MAAAEWTVLFVPPGSYTLYSRLKITKPRIILRGAGSDKVTLNIPRSLTDIYGSNPATKTGGWVFFGAFIGEGERGRAAAGQQQAAGKRCMR